MLLVGLALLIIAMAVAVPKISQQIKRDREVEMIHRGVQYTRAIQKFYRKFSRYPTSIEQLENTNNIRFLRKKYTDPMSADGKWRFVRYGEVQLGQAGPNTPGVGGGSNLPPVLAPALGDKSDPQSPSQPGSPTGSSQPSSPGQPAGSMFGSSGTSGVFGGGPIMGVASTSQKQGIHEFDKKSKYSQWLFVYDPNLDRGGLITGPYNPKAFVGQPNQNGTPAAGPTPGAGPGGPGPTPGSGPNPQPMGGPPVQPPTQQPPQ